MCQSYITIQKMLFSDFNLSKCADGLLPVVIQDATTLKVLMLGYMNEEAFNKTQNEGRVTFFSRTRQKLWTKGETSGHYLQVVDSHVDCDADTLLLRVIPHGPTCHRGTTACFDTPEEEGFVRRLFDIVRQRHTEMPEGAYTTRRCLKGVTALAPKVGEEAVESVVEAVDGNRRRFTYEAADLLYHLTVLCEQMGVSLKDLEEELARRHR